ncbi:DUF1642 domain-containing protein [Lactococcus lactis subsp. lactis KLDS 4.0325]|nr:DUF1642 domain-containing protein [Lactococcus lactis subsp. lactis KLDS 4.0325]
MTKFEEEFKALTSWDWVNVDLIQQILTRFGNWHSDEEFQAKEKEIKRLRKINHLYKKAKGNAERLAVDRGERLNQAQDELASLESQLQQQALPVVPEWLDIEIKHFKSTSKHPTADVVFGVADVIVAVKNGNTHSKLYDYLFCGKQDVCNQHQETFALAFITGKYKVEKPQLFYLKAKELLVVGDYDHVEDLWLDWNKNFTPKKQDAHKFTQQEIDSMETGNYEQIEVEK